ncbi:hypothetical protein Q8A59_10600 [Edwardsiella piscicida]|nr:hypothetical protein [Edwardsiella piscicida]WLJ45513.1 hypothetical protein Q8A59_10600 [Edwardsiella piscicida]
MVNPTPYYVTLADVTINDRRLNGVQETMVAPLGELILPFIPAASAQRIRYSAINDYGGRADVLQRDL